MMSPSLTFTGADHLVACVPTETTGTHPMLQHECDI